MENSGTSKRPCFIEEDDGLASLADMEAGFSGNSQSASFSRPLRYGRSNSLRNPATPVSSPRSVSVRFYDSGCEDHPPYFLDSCFLCNKPLADNKDIFMYRGDTPFCSEECRQRQIEIDEGEEKNLPSSSMKALRNKDQRKSASPNKAQEYSLRTGTVAAG
ncbi:hypothetical protein SLE2022_225840 [Rubroshorea leprosula]